MGEIFPNAPFPWLKIAMFFVLSCRSKSSLFHFRKKKKNKAKKVLEDVSQSTSKGRSEKDHKEEPVDSRTPAEIAYEKIQEKRVSKLTSYV